ncbi:hypothetical protein CCAX7_28020 [Capsulimonas corticalis]|uniref:Uncharacterized protein n=1 Tax=Capsulimonas corticalis TaxID=2219043 RepID=A0A402CTF9_9BACT|nr:phosphate-starvation-inducible PsiE family protein [Capsulimonas corticalis]BDI30751.1 hypothetical protein CCAX7_28020 [Capsulimonas corticalis]
MKHFIEKTESILLWVLAFLLLAAVVLGTVDLIFIFVEILRLPPVMVVKPETLFHMFGEFLIILMGLKLIKLVLLNMPGHSSPMTAVVEVALIGVGQKVVTMDLKAQSPATLVGVAALILALSVSYGVCYYIQAQTKGKTAAAASDENL